MSYARQSFIALPELPASSPFVVCIQLLGAHRHLQARPAHLLPREKRPPGQCVCVGGLRPASPIIARCRQLRERPRAHDPRLRNVRNAQLMWRTWIALVYNQLRERHSVMYVSYNLHL